MTIHVMVVDDHALIRDGLRIGCEHEGDLKVVAEAVDAQSALNAIAEVQPDVLVLDLRLPDRDGVDALPELLNLSPATRTLVVTADDDLDVLRDALAAGAGGFVTKFAGFKEICTAIRMVAQGNLYLNATLDVHPGELLRSTSTECSTAKAKIAGLSDREQEVLNWLARGMTNQEVADEIFLSVKSIETYRYRLQKKLGLKSRAELTQLAVESGLLATAPGESQPS